jgi:CRP-like cAMP-binding protein
MAKSTPPQPHSPNRLLAALSTPEYQRLRPHLEPVSLTFKQVLYEAHTPLAYAYFPHTGVVSMVTILADGTAIEVGMVGNEGMVGVPLLLGAERMPVRTFVQVPGEAVRVAAAAFRAAVSQPGPLLALLHRYTQALLVQLTQSSACNRAHPIAARCARWLLMTHDRMDTTQFPLTQEFLSQMLGVRRAGVSEVAAKLQKAGLIRYSRGQLTVVDRAGLEAAACECYRVIREEYARLLA